jgi:hypothetical protein
MAGNFGLDNAIGWAHLQLRGGWKNIAVTTGLSALGIGILILVTLQLGRVPVGLILGGWTSALMALEAALLVLLGCNTIGTAVKTDLAGIIESHRLMPVSPAAAILGYLFGPTTQAMGLAGALLVIGTVTAFGAQLPVAHWLMPHAILFLFAVFAWTLVVFAGFGSRHGSKLLWGVVIGGGVMAKGALWAALPGLSVLMSPLIGHTIFNMRANSAEITWPLLASIAAQGYIGTICFLGAARKYRRSDVPALSPLLGLLLLAGWMVISVLGIRQWEDFASDIWRNVHLSRELQFLCSLLAALLLAMAPVASAAWGHDQWRRHRSTDDPALRGHTFPPLLAVLLATGLVVVVACAAPEPGMSWTQACIRTGVAVGAFLTQVSFLLRMIYRVRGRPLVSVGLWAAITCLGPFIIDSVRYGMSSDPDSQWMGTISMCSPLGALIGVWDKQPIGTTFGLVAQVGLAVVAAGLFYGPAMRK